MAKQFAIDRLGSRFEHRVLVFENGYAMITLTDEQYDRLREEAIMSYTQEEFDEFYGRLSLRWETIQDYSKSILEEENKEG